MDFINEIDSHAVSIAAIIALISFLFSSYRQRKIEKSSMYQELELASINLIKWETENRKILIRVREQYTNGCQNISPEDEEFIKAKYFSTLNLFELCISSAKRRTLPKNVFGSWLPWIHEFANDPGFREHWSEIETNYVPECREIIATAIKNSEEDFIKKICSIRNIFLQKKYGLKVKDWIKNKSKCEAKNCNNEKIIFDCANVEVKVGKAQNIEKYLTIFNESKHDNYISHGEVYYGRATHDMKWANDIIIQMKQEFKDYFKDEGKSSVLEILYLNEIIGFTIIEYNRKTNVAVLSDIMIKKEFQGGGIGTEALRKIEKFIQNEKIDMILLESGINNKKVHSFFTKNGYMELSKEFSKRLN